MMELLPTPTISGTVTDDSQIVLLKAGFDSTDVNNYVDITASLQSDGSFTLDKSTLESIKGDILADDSYTLYLQAIDSEGNTSNVYELSFTLDSITPPTSNIGFAIKTESKLTINGGGDLDGEPFDLNDDALIYAAKGFKINGNIDLPVKLNPDGTPQLDDSGRKVLRDNAVTVADGYTTSTGPNNQYAGLNPPSILEEAITVDIPAYDNLLQQKLDSFIPDNSQTITFDISDSANRVSNANSWNQKFPAPGTADNPRVVEVIGGELSIPNNVNLSNYVIIVQQGNIRFKGSNNNLDNVVLVTENGDINLAKAKSENVSVFASGSINMNGASTFAGDTLIASGSNVTFRGASKDINTSDTIRVVSSGDITFNGASDTKGIFETAGKFTSNGTSTIYGMIAAKGDIRFNGGVRVVATNIDSASPIINAALTNDTGVSDSDNITNDPTISGTVIDDGEIVEFTAGFNDADVANYVNVLPQRSENGNFSFDRATLESIYGDALPDGNHTLHLLSKDASSNVSNLFDLTFTLDTVTPAPDNLDLTATDDSGVDDSDNITNNSTPEITGNSEARAKVELLNNSIKIGEATADNNGNWQIATNNLADGDYSITAIATDIAGNQNQSDVPLSLTVDTSAPDAPINLKLSPDSDSGISNSDNITNDSSPTITGLAASDATVELFSDGVLVGTTTADNEGNWQIDVSSNLTDGVREITAVATDVAGNQSTSSAPLSITIDSALPQITLTNPVTGTDLNQSSRLVGVANGTGSDLISFSYKFDSGEDIPVTLNGNGEFDQEFDLTGLGNGSYTLILSTRDVAGNVETAVYSVSVVLDSPPVVTAALVNDSGESNTDNITNDPTINGTITDDGNIVTLVAGFNDVEVDNYVDVTARLQSDGSFSLDKASLETIYGDILPDGNHVLRIQAIDDYGNTSETFNLNFTLDTTPPPISNPDLPTNDDSGISNSDNITNNNTPNITGNTEAGSKLELFVDANSIGEVAVDESGNWVSTTAPLTDGEYEITATATDIAGNTSNSDIPLQLNIDTALPSINFATNPENQTLNAQTRLVGNASGTGSNITAIEYSFDQNPAATTITLDDALNFNQEFDLTGLENGSHILTVAITDAAGNVNTIQYNVTVAVDEQPPLITASLVSDTGLDSTDKITNNPNISGTVTDENQIVELKAGFNNLEVDNYVDITARLQSDGSFTLDKTTLEIIYGDSLPDGSHTLNLISQDEFGNQSDIYNFEFTLDTTTLEPTLDLTSDSDSGISSSDDITLTKTPTISGTGEAGATVSLLEDNQNLGETIVGNDGTWEITTSELIDGEYELTAVATDIAGNQSTSSTPLSINIDSELPQFSLTTPIDNSPLTPESKIIGTVNGTGSDINAVTYRFNDLEEIPVSFNSTGEFDQAFDLTGLNNGDYTVTVTTTDVAGNVNTNQYNVIVEIDINSPIIDVSLNNDTAPNNTTNTDRITSDPSISGTITDNNDIVSLLAGFNDNLFDVTSSLQSDGSFSFDRNQLETILGNTLEDGIQTLQLQATDEFGNQSEIFSYTFTLDTTVNPPQNLDLPADKDSGVDSSDNITNDNSPIITGNAEANSTVQLSQNGEVVGETIATEGGSWEITTNNNLADGNFEYRARFATDIAGNVSSSSIPLAIVVDTILPSINLTTATDTPLTVGDKLTGIADGTGSLLENLTYSFDDGEEFTLNVDSEGNFDQDFDLNGLDNGSHILNITSTDIAGNVNTIQYNVTVNIDDVAPVIAAGLFRDTAPNNQTNTDNITFDATISGTVTEDNQIVELKAAFDNISIESGIDITSQLQPDGQFTLNQTTLETIYGDSLPDGTHTLSLQAKDEYGNVSSSFDITFTLDTNIIQPVFDLDTESDSEEQGDKKTTFEIVTLTGQTESNATVSLQGTDLTTTADSEGKYSFTDISLELGDNSFTAISTDIAGNENTYTEVITRLNPPAGITLDTNTIAENSITGTVIGILGSNRH